MRTSLGCSFRWCVSKFCRRKCCLLYQMIATKLHFVLNGGIALRLLVCFSVSVLDSCTLCLWKTPVVASERTKKVFIDFLISSLSKAVFDLIVTQFRCCEIQYTFIFPCSCFRTCEREDMLLQRVFRISFCRCSVKPVLGAFNPRAEFENHFFWCLSSIIKVTN